MCGIAGIVFAEPTRAVPASVLDAPLEAIVHRGPDGEGRLVAPGIAAGMRRLAIIDLAGGDQPLYNEDRTVGVLYNGELYNYRELRAWCEARGHVFRTHSDTETFVHLYEELGDDFLERLDGMFAFVLWDTKRQRALLARDRYGVKPLYLCPSRAGLAFASEVKSLVAMGLTEPEVRPESLGDYFRFLWVPEPRTCWRGVTRMPPGTSVVVEGGRVGPLRRYFKPSVRPRAVASAEPETTQRLVREAVQRQLVADVPVGVFLSGGLDSSLVAAQAVALGATVPAHTMKIRAEDGGLDEADEDAVFAAEVARALGLEQHLHEARPDLVDLLPEVSRFTDDPIADPALLNTLLICRAARAQSRVLLSGMGADEVAGGYRRHLAAHALRRLYHLPGALRGPLLAGARGVAAALAATGARGPLARRALKALRGAPRDVRALGPAYAQWTPDAWIARLGLERQPDEALVGLMAERVDADLEEPLEAAMAFDVALYLPSHNLRYVDKMSMAASVEVRVPYLDNALAAHLSGLPYASRVRGGTGKVALREAAKPLVPRGVLERAKAGFGAPVRGWLAGPLRPLLERTLSREALSAQGLLSPEGARALLDAHARGEGDLAYSVWALLALTLWYDAARAPRSGPAPEPCFAQ